MSEAVAKAERRDLRRTLGESGLAVVDQHADLLTKLKHNVEVLAARVVKLEEGHRVADDRLTAVENELTDLSNGLAMLRRDVDLTMKAIDRNWRMPFVARLRWLFRGTF